MHAKKHFSVYERSLIAQNHMYLPSFDAWIVLGSPSQNQVDCETRPLAPKTRKLFTFSPLEKELSDLRHTEPYIGIEGEFRSKPKRYGSTYGRHFCFSC